MKHIVMFSGGVTSWAAAKRVAQTYGTANLTLLFADTGIEDPDLYRFLDEGSANIGIPVTHIAEGRTPWQVFWDERFLGNSRIDPCSKILKRQLLDRWLANHCDPGNTMVAYGFDWMEVERLERMQSYGGPWQRWAPLQKKPYMDKAGAAQWLRSEGIKAPRLYELGFQHNNCGGTCVKAGQAAWRMVLREFPEHYKEWEENEQRLRDYLKSDISILKDRSDGTSKPLTLRSFRERLQAGGQCDMMDWGTCGCWQTTP